MSCPHRLEYVAIEVMFKVLDSKVLLEVRATPLRHITATELVRLVHVLPTELTESVSETFRVKVCCTPEFVAFVFPKFKPLDRELIELKPFWGE